VQRRFSTLALAALIPVFGTPTRCCCWTSLWTDWLLQLTLRDQLYYGLLAIGLLTYDLRVC
jgi:hypothetical protein